MTELPTTFPPLPHSRSWPANIQAAHQVLTDLYRNASAVLQLEDVDPLQIAFHLDSITSDAVPVLCAMEREGESEQHVGDPQLPEEWLHAGAQVLGELVNSLQHLRESARGRYVNLFHLIIIHIIHSYIVKILASQYRTPSLLSGRVSGGVHGKPSI